jgi:hypothetical protein
LDALNPWHIDSWTLFGRVPVAVALVLLFVHVQRGSGTRRAALAISALAAGAAVGTALLHSIVGVLAGGAIAWAVTLRVLGVRLPTTFLLTRLLLFIVGVGRFGCFFAGCCFGRPTEVAWAAHYGPDTLAHALHFHPGLVSVGHAALPVHPVQLYEGVAVLLLAAALPWARLLIRSDQAVAFGVAALYLSLRAALEPLRAMFNTPGSTTYAGPLSLFQWGALAAALVLVVAAILSARRPVPAGTVAPEPPPRVLGATWCAHAVLALLAQTSMTPFLVRLSLLTLSVSLIVLVATEWSRAPRRWLALGTSFTAASALLTPLILRADNGADAGESRHWIYDVQPQSGSLVRIGDQSTSPRLLEAAHEVLVPAQTAQRLSLVIYSGGGWSRLSFGGCNGPTEIWEHSVFLAGLGVQGERGVSELMQTWQLRLGVFGDVWRHTEEQSGKTLSVADGMDVVGTLNGWYQWDWKWAGFGLGAQLGLGRMVSYDRPLFPIDNVGFVMPGVYLRVGPPVFALEAGTGSLRQMLPGAQVNLRSILGGHEIRLGFESSAPRITVAAIRAPRA